MGGSLSCAPGERWRWVGRGSLRGCGACNPYAIISVVLQRLSDGSFLTSPVLSSQNYYLPLWELFLGFVEFILNHGVHIVVFQWPTVVQIMSGIQSQVRGSS